MSFTTLLTLHKAAVIIFFIIYLLKTALLLFNQYKALGFFSKVIKVPEMIISFLFLITGIWLLFLIPSIDGFMIAKILTLLACIPLAVIGFKRQNKIFALFSLFLITMVYLFGQMSKMHTGEAETNVSDGQALYGQLCSRCHGEDGKLGLMDSKDLSITELKPEDIRKIIVNGKGAMPGFKNSMTDQQHDAVVQYVLSIKK